MRALQGNAGRESPHFARLQPVNGDREKEVDHVADNEMFLCDGVKPAGSSRAALGNFRDVEDFEFIELLGQGFFGTVWKVREKSDSGRTPGAEMVLKVPNSRDHVVCHNSAKRIIIREDYMLKMLKHHPNILRSRGICLQRVDLRWQLNLLIDYCDEGSLQQLILNRQRLFPWMHRCLVLRDICCAMNCVHELGYMHRDLTSMNVLLQSQPPSLYPKAVVADFGLSNRIPQCGELLQQAGTSNWMSPEMLREEFYNEKTDLFSFGIIACQCIARIDADHDAGLYRTAQFGLDYVRFTVCCPPETPLVLLKLAFMCCLRNPDSRPSFKSLDKQLRKIIKSWEPNETTMAVSSPEETRLERSRSDAAIMRKMARRDVSSIQKKRKTVAPKYHVRWKGNATAPLATELNCTEARKRLSTPSEQFKELAVSLAHDDPLYEESLENPFARHSRYRSMRKMRPPELFTTGSSERKSTTASDKLYASEGLSSFHEELEAEQGGKHGADVKAAHAGDMQPGHPNHTRARKQLIRSYSLPKNEKRNMEQPIDGNRGNELQSLLGLKRMSIVPEAGEQRDLREKIMLSFRDYDQKFKPTKRHSSLIPALAPFGQADRVQMEVKFSSSHPVPCAVDYTSTPEPRGSSSPSTSSYDTLHSVESYKSASPNRFESETVCFTAYPIPQDSQATSSNIPADARRIPCAGEEDSRLRGMDYGGAVGAAPLSEVISAPLYRCNETKNGGRNLPQKHSSTSCCLT